MHATAPAAGEKDPGEHVWHCLLVPFRNVPGAHTQRKFWKTLRGAHGAIVTLMLIVTPAAPKSGIEGDTTFSSSTTVEPMLPDTASDVNAAE
jgi:hypothetical protein